MAYQTRPTSRTVQRPVSAASVQNAPATARAPRLLDDSCTAQTRAAEMASRGTAAASTCVTPPASETMRMRQTMLRARSSRSNASGMRGLSRAPRRQSHPRAVIATCLTGACRLRAVTPTRVAGHSLSRTARAAAALLRASASWAPWSVGARGAWSGRTAAARLL